MKGEVAAEGESGGGMELGEDEGGCEGGGYRGGFESGGSIYTEGFFLHIFY